MQDLGWPIHSRRRRRRAIGSGIGFDMDLSIQAQEVLPKMPMNTISISRRRFAQLLSASAACAIGKPVLSLGKSAAESAPAQTSSVGVVRLSSNENPYGPAANALKAMNDAFNLSCRYPDEHVETLIDSLAKLNGINRDQILLGDGSGEILKVCAEAFTGPRAKDAKQRTRGGALVAADPTFEAILRHASTNGAEVVKVPLTSNFSHDLPRMMAAAKDGLIYICNPNNPTASITPKNDLREFIARTPPSTMILVDEAYYHYADSPDYESVIPLVKDHPNLLVARTFSKVYGMAGLRCGYCVGQREMIEQLRSHEPWDSVNIMALAAATASLNDPDQVANGRRLNSETRAFVTHELESMGYKQIPSQANFIMVDLKRPVVPLIQSCKQRKVEVGRLFPSMPNHMRVTIGKKEEMDAFLSTLKQVVT
ncbi:MAG: histidinol-phosphate aminotransferase [Verrucomicrobiota bacterium]